VTTQYALWPRGLRCFDYASQSLLWEYPCAATPFQVLLYNLSGEATPEILIGCYSPNNGARLPEGEDDAHCYLHVLSAEGQRLWSQQVGGTYMRCFVHPAQSGGSSVLYALVVRNEEAHRQSEDGLPVESRLLKFDAAGRELARYEVPLELGGLVISDLSNSGQQQIYTGDSRGFLHVLDEDLHLRRQVQIVENPYDWVSLRAEVAGDLDGDGHSELLLQSAEVEFRSGNNLGRPEGAANFRRYHNHSLQVYDASLAPRTRYPLAELSKTPPGARVALLSPERSGRRGLIVLEQQVRILELSSSWRDSPNARALH